MVNERKLNNIQINTPCGSTKESRLAAFFFFVPLLLKSHGQ